MNNLPILILASASPRRLKLLQEIGINPLVIPALIKEIFHPNELPEKGALRLALEKTQWVLKQINHYQKDTYILSADTIVLLFDQILGKPQNTEEASHFLSLLSGKTHTVITAYAMLDETGTLICKGYEKSAVTMKSLSNEEIGEYVKTGEPMDKAGAYAAQGLGGEFILKIKGSMNNVIGLPTEVLYPWFKKLGFFLNPLPLDGGGSGRGWCDKIA